MNTRELIETRLTPAQELSDLWDKQARDEFPTKEARTALDTMTPGAYVNHVPDGTFQRRFCVVLVALIWIMTSFVIVFAIFGTNTLASSQQSTRGRLSMTPDDYANHVTVLRPQGSSGSHSVLQPDHGTRQEFGIVSASREPDPEQILDKSRKERNPMMKSENRQATINEPYTQTKGEWLKTRPGEHCLIRVSAKDTQGLYSLVEIVSDPGDATPMHIHEREDEHIAVLEGTARIAFGDKIFDAQAGDVVTLRKGIPHAWGNRSSAPLRIAILASPGGVEEILRLISNGNQADIPTLAERFHVRNIGPTPF